MYITPDVYETASIAVIDSLDTIVVWGKTYIQWGNDFYTKDYWNRILNHSFMLRFKESATDNEISEFIQSNDLEIRSLLITGTYILKFTDSTHIFQFMLEQEGNVIIEYIEPDFEICVY